MKIIINLNSGTIIGTTTDANHVAQPSQLILDAPAGFSIEQAEEWIYDGSTVKRDLAGLLAKAKAARKARIKIEAQTLIEATDWKLQRAKEREAAGWATLAEVNAVLAERESIRQSSNTAEAAVESMTDAASVTAFAWSVSTNIATPRLLTHRQFMVRFTNAELQALLTVVAGSVAVRVWWEQYQAAENVNLDDPETRAGVTALESAGILSAGRAAEILA